MFVESVLFEIISVIFIVLANAFFVAAEFAIVKVRSTQLQPLAEKNNQRAKVALKIVTNLDKYLSASQVGITMTSLGLGWIGEPVTAKLLEPVFHLFNITNSRRVYFPDLYSHINRGAGSQDACYKIPAKNIAGYRYTFKHFLRGL